MFVKYLLQEIRESQSE